MKKNFDFIRRTSSNWFKNIQYKIAMKQNERPFILKIKQILYDNNYLIHT